MSKWISVEENKPDFGKAVLIHLHKSGFITVGYRITPTEKDFDFAWQMFGDTKCIVYQDDYVSHWQPLPEPPKQ